LKEQQHKREKELELVKQELMAQALRIKREQEDARRQADESQAKAHEQARETKSRSDRLDMRQGEIERKQEAVERDRVRVQEERESLARKLQEAEKVRAGWREIWIDGMHVRP
jgi:hypothetical protein